MNRDLGLDDARDRQMHDTFDPDEPDPDAHSPADRPPAEPRNAAREHLVSLLSPEQITRVAAREKSAEPRKRDWTNVGSPIIRARLDPEQRATLHARATTDGVTPSDVIRAALDAYLDRRP